MTREEAIENLKGLLESNYVDSFYDEENEALEMAIKALELDYKTAFQIACALLNGDILYGTDAESIFSEIMKKDDCVCSFDYENYILTHLNELRDDKALSQEPTAEKSIQDTTELEKALLHIKTRADAWAVKEVEKALSQEPCDDIAQERYKDLCEYFGGAKDILKSREDFKAWLDRIKWHIRKAEELYEKYEYKKQPCDDTISRQAALNSLIDNTHLDGYDLSEALDAIENKEKLPPVTQKSETVTEFADRCRECGARYGKLLEQKSGKYTADELKVFADGISLSLCSKKSAQHWSYDEKTAEQIRWLECLHSKVMTDIADMNCGARMVEPQESEEQTE